MKITKLKNPKTNIYLELKDFVLSHNFPWYWCSGATPHIKNHEGHHDVPYFSHEFLRRPDSSELEPRFPKVCSENASIISSILVDILDLNKIYVNCFLRINANCVFSTQESINTMPHKDHSFPHKNILVYLTDVGGNTVVEDEFHEPKEDDVIVFNGLEHYVTTPKHTDVPVRRIVLVATFI